MYILRSVYFSAEQTLEHTGFRTIKVLKTVQGHEIEDSNGYVYLSLAKITVIAEVSGPIGDS